MPPDVFTSSSANVPVVKALSPFTSRSSPPTPMNTSTSSASGNEFRAQASAPSPDTSCLHPPRCRRATHGHPGESPCPSCIAKLPFAITTPKASSATEPCNSSSMPCVMARSGSSKARRGLREARPVQLLRRRRQACCRWPCSPSRRRPRLRTSALRSPPAWPFTPLRSSARYVVSSAGAARAGGVLQRHQLERVHPTAEADVARLDFVVAEVVRGVVRHAQRRVAPTTRPGPPTASRP